jgi:hypothetical protein
MAPDAPSAHSIGMPSDARDTAAQSGDEVNGREHPRAVKRFRERAQIPQAPHVQRDVDETDVQEHAG